MDSYMASGIHRTTCLSHGGGVDGSLALWCQDSEQAPTWAAATRHRIQSEGRQTKVEYPSEARTASTPLTPRTGLGRSSTTQVILDKNVHRDLRRPQPMDGCGNRDFGLCELFRLAPTKRAGS